jgi:CrcB protein
LLLVTGFCVGFTTFSSFTYEGVQMMMENRWFTFFIYILSSVAIGLAATFFGYKLTS